MCYDIQTGLQREIRLAKRKGESREYIDRLITEYNAQNPESPIPSLHWHVSGFAHPALPVIVQKDSGLALEVRQWGLIPRWCKDMPTALKMRTQCLNARCETLFEKPAFRSAAPRQRAVLVVDAFYEHHHFMGRTYPFRIHRKDNEPLLMAALYEDWTDRTTGEVFATFAIVTTVGNALMAAIHNNPKLEAGPRMPLILDDDALDIWLSPHATEEDILSLRIPLSSGEGSGEGSSGERSFLTAHTVRPLRGKAALGNVPQAAEAYDYPELAMGEILGE
jgi:putative SOS response-associated peptidase YedK